MELTINLPKPHARQLAFRDSKAKRKVVCAGRRGGKTTGMAILAVEALLNGRRVLEAAPTADQTDAFWQACVTALAEPITAGVVRKNETNRVLELATGARIRCKTAHNADTLRGDYADLLILDEFSLMDEDAWKQVGAPMLLDNNGDAAFIFTPKSMNHAYTLYQQAVSDTSGRWAAFHFTSLDNPHLSREALAEIVKDMTEDDYKQEVLAEFLQGSGAVFRNLDACLTASPTTPGEHRGHLIVGGLDWGMRDYTALSLFCCNCVCEVYLDRFHGVAWALQRDRVLASLEKWNAKYVRVEKNSIGSPNLEALRDAAPESIFLIGFETTMKSKGKLIQGLALAFEKAVAKWLPDKTARHELLAYESSVTETGYIKYGAPEGQNDDTVICRGLAWMTARPQVPIPLTDEEREESELPENLRASNAPPYGPGWERDGWEIARSLALGKAKKAEEKRNRDMDNPWGSASPLDNMADSPWGDWQK
jgi:hypothetical protein